MTLALSFLLFIFKAVDATDCPCGVAVTLICGRLLIFFLVGKTLGYVPLPRTQEETQQLLHTPSCLPEFWFVTERVFSHTLWASPSLPPGRVYTECGQ